MTKTEIAEIDALVLAFVTEHPSSRAGAVADHLAALPGFKARIAKAWKDGGALTSTKADLLKGDDWAATIARRLARVGAGGHAPGMAAAEGVAA